MKIKIINKPTTKELIDIKNLYKESGWWNDYDSIKRLKIFVEKSYIFIVAVKDKKIIGMARVISDSINDAYIQDFTVLKNYRNLGIGTKILKFILKILIKRNFKWIGLIAEKKAYSLYKKCGFKVYKNKIPMIYDFKKN